MSTLEAVPSIRILPQQKCISNKSVKIEPFQEDVWYPFASHERSYLRDELRDIHLNFYPNDTPDFFMIHGTSGESGFYICVRHKNVDTKFILTPWETEPTKCGPIQEKTWTLHDMSYFMKYMKPAKI